MDNKAMALTVNTFDDLLNMNADMHDSIRRLTVKYADCKSSIRHIRVLTRFYIQRMEKVSSSVPQKERAR